MNKLIPVFFGCTYILICVLFFFWYTYGVQGDQLTILALLGFPLSLLEVLFATRDTSIYVQAVSIGILGFIQYVSLGLLVARIFKKRKSGTLPRP